MVAFRRTCIAAAVVVTASSALFPSPAGAQVVKSLPGAPSYGQSVDAAGNVVGISVDKPNLWRPSGNTYLGEPLALPAGQSWGGANAINASGSAIAGYTKPADLTTATATVWTVPPASAAYAPTPLPSPATAVLTDAYAVNAGGEVAGYLENANENTTAVVWTPPAVAGGSYAANVLPRLSGWTDTAATAINGAGHVAGYTFGHPVDIFRAAVWEKSGATYAPKNVVSADSALVTAMNDYGTGAGVYAGDQPMVMVQFEGDYYAGELDVPFGTTDGATNAVNNHDALVGYLKDPTTGTIGAEAALWLPTETSWQLVNLDQWLNQVSPALGSQWTLTEAYGISDNWLVTGVGRVATSGFDRGFVLDVSSLVPEPTAAALAMLAAPMLLVRRRRRR